MPQFEITSPDGKTYEVTAPDGASQADVLKYVQDNAAKAAPVAYGNPQGQQPTIGDRIVGSPVGRAVHDAVIAPIMGLGGLLSKLDPTAPDPAKVNSLMEKPYQASLSANRNTPGYQAARQQQEQMLAAKGGSGFTDQMLAPYLPAMAGIAGLASSGGSLDAMNAASDAQAAGQGKYQAEHPVRALAGGLAGGLLARPDGGMRLPPAAAQPSVPSIADLKSAASQAYDRVDSAGHIISNPAYDQMVSDLQQKLANEGIDKTLHPNALAAYNRLADSTGTPITFKGMDTLRKVAGDAIGASMTNKADQRLGYMIQNHIDDFVDGLKPSDLLGATDPAQTISDLNEARNLWSRASQAQIIQNQIDKAGIKASANYSQSGMENALRQQFKSLALNDKAMSRLAPNVQQAVKDVAKGSSVGNVLRAIGKYAPHGPVATAAGMGTGAMLGGIPGAATGGLASIAVPIAGEAARAGATRMTQSAAQRALNLAALGPTAAIPAQPMLQAPRLTQQSAIPLGLLASGLLNPQPAQ